MRLPWGRLSDIGDLFLRSREIEILGSLSFEERCCAIPEQLFDENTKVTLVEITDPPDGFPNYEQEINIKTDQNRERLEAGDVLYEKIQAGLLATEDDLLDMLEGLTTNHQSESVVILDLTSLPKRFFCFILKRLLLIDTFSDVIVTYTEPLGYTGEHLAEDPMTCDHLPGFSAPLPPKGDTLVISVGYESLSIRSLMEVYADRKKAIKLILAFPSLGRSTKRQWATIREMGVEPQEVQGNIESIASWDAEEVYRKLEQWHGDADGLALAPFGPKTHSLGMALFALKHDAGLFYTQPKVYHPDYSFGEGESWAYVVKWKGVPCYERYSTHL